MIVTIFQMEKMEAQRGEVTQAGSPIGELL